jgi:hypothetical protein
MTWSWSYAHWIQCTVVFGDSSIDSSFLTNLVANDRYGFLIQPKPNHQNPKISDPTQRNPWVDPTHGHVWLQSKNYLVIRLAANPAY